MSLRLFRSTGYASVLVPGEMRVAMHPAWTVVAVGLWIATACNVALWRAAGAAWAEGETFSPQTAASLIHAMLQGVAIGAAVAAVLSLLCWRRTLKPAGSAALLVASIVAAGLWVNGVNVDRELLSGDGAGLFPGWVTLLGWRVPLLITSLGLAPSIALWHAQVRRLTGPDQWRANLTLMTASAATCVIALAMRSAGPGL